jgi:hypothetical protein
MPAQASEEEAVEVVEDHEDGTRTVCGSTGPKSAATLAGDTFREPERRRGGH